MHNKTIQINKNTRLNLYFDEYFVQDWDDSELSRQLKNGDITPYILEVIVKDQTGYLNGSNTLGGVLLREGDDPVEYALDYGMIDTARTELAEKIQDVLKAYGFKEKERNDAH